MFYNNKAKASEIRIRLIGNEIGLQHIIHHPVGYNLLLEYLEKEHCSENLKFWFAVSFYLYIS